MSKRTHISIIIDRKSIINTSVNHILPDKPGISRGINCQHHYRHRHHHLNHRQHHQHLLREDLTINANIVSHGPDQVDHCVLLRLGQGGGDENKRRNKPGSWSSLLSGRKSTSLPDKALPSCAIKEAPHLIAPRLGPGVGAMKRKVLGTTVHYRLAIAVIKNDLKLQKDSSAVIPEERLQDRNAFK